MNILYSSHFARKFKKIPEELKKVILEREKIFRNDPFDPLLKTHKLDGYLSFY